MLSPPYPAHTAANTFRCFTYSRPGESHHATPGNRRQAPRNSSPQSDTHAHISCWLPNLLGQAHSEEGHEPDWVRGLTKTEAEELLDWLEAHGDRRRGALRGRHGLCRPFQLPGEKRTALAANKFFTETANTSKLTLAEEYAQVLLLANEFAFVD